MNKEKEKNLILSDLWHIILMIGLPIICVGGVSLIIYKIRIAMIYLICVLSIVIFIFSGKKVKLNAVNVSMFLLLVFIAIQLLYSYDPASTLDLLILYTCAFTLLFLDIPENVIHRIITIIYVFCIVIAFSIIISVFIDNCMLKYFGFIVNPYNSPSITESITKELDVGAYSGFAREKGEAAFIMNVGLAISFSKFFCGDKSKKTDLLFLVLFISALILTSKRTMFLIPIICFVVFMVISKIRGKAFKICIIAISSLISLFFIFMFLPDFANLFYRFMDTENLETLGSRDSLWKYMAMMTSKYWMFGAGFGSYNQFAYDHGLRVYGEKWIYHGHNSYYQGFCELGVVGGSLFIIFLACALFTTFKYIRSDRFTSKQRSILFFALYIQLMITVYAITGNPIYTRQMIFTLFFATGTVLCIGRQNTVTTEKIPTGVEVYG